MTNLAVSIEELQQNDKQWQAFTTEGHCVVLAPPGSGKTKLLTTRLAYDLTTVIPRPHGAACITFTNPAAAELRRRVDQLGVPSRPTRFVGTVHSFALQRVLRPFASMFGRRDLLERTIATNGEITTAYDSAIKLVYGWTNDTRDVRSTVSILRHQLAGADQWQLSGDRIRAVAERYEDLLRDQGLTDFDELIAVAVQFVEQHQAVRSVLRSCFPRIYVDEYQDLAPGLDRIVRALCFGDEGGCQLFAVGDPDQAVFGWIGARPELLEEVEGLSYVQAVHLEQNYRSSDAILQVANRLMRRHKQPMVGHRSGGKVSAVRCIGGMAGEIAQATAAVRELNASGTPLHEIVVVAPWNAHCVQMAGALRRVGIPAFVRDTEYPGTEATRFVESCAIWSSRGRETSGCRLSELLRYWRSTLSDTWTFQKDVELTTLLMRISDDPTMAASAFLKELLAAGLTRAMQESGRGDDLQSVNEMDRALTDGVLHALRVIDLADRQLRTDRVEITTMTSSKGLEFDVVLLLGADEKLVPSFKPADLPEDRRKFYVSLTRARHEVRIFYSGVVDWKSGPGVTAPSRFLREIGLVH